MNIPQASHRTILEGLFLLEGRAGPREAGATNFRTKRMTKYANTQ